ncbi:phosphohydrolase [Brevibacillus agri]|uniref:Phosphohydrolase n=1 Tax=Brevibacillus agri TaxID=51101 RepID=A0A3M8A278_9BACL|nr:MULTISPECIES: MSMEG_1061 family FMN-dependent PPOX-type flavoprotein [Brevibacillus]ELK42489.1 pyridoxamine 5'-phosphate oxidase-like FMN-binding protein [Brevibacillus agri BAB-2500]EJL46459.1 PPOX class probable FMN-dependent enzyme, DR_2398 family [Brevibacillus sp. CF112]MBG9564729.1 phosphohydrolase [Brevibacillus agri]MBY0054338.1 pyridoxamine 5'-phosphate oxidase family protein [Brevibacillus agri]MCG5251657.1 pyridoxamine 5'-phosphate oxidase family protein [Brevibacillus agri]
MWEEKWQKDRVASADELRSLVGVPHETVANKSIAQVESHVIHYLSMSPLFFLATADADGRCDVSPRGDEPGFVKVLDERHVIFPERMGNRRVDSLLNILANPQVGMIFLIPGLEEVLRINGKATITKNAELLAAQNWKGKTLGLGVVVEVEECFIHCPRAFKQAGVWNTDSWADKADMPSIMEMFRAHLRINGVALKENG